MNETLTITLVGAEREGWRIIGIADNVSDPENPEYGRFLTRSELSELVLLSKEERATIEDWLRSHGIEPVVSEETGKQLMFARGTLDQVVAAFGEDLAGRLMRDEESQAKGVRGQG